MMISSILYFRMQGHVGQSVMCLPADMCLTADPGVASAISAWSHTFMEIDREIISRRFVVSYKRKYVHEALFNRLVKLTQQKNMVRWTDCPDMTVAFDLDVKHQTKTNNILGFIQSNCCHIIRHTRSHSTGRYMYIYDWMSWGLRLDPSG